MTPSGWPQHKIRRERETRSKVWLVVSPVMRSPAWYAAKFSALYQIHLLDEFLLEKTD